MTFILFVRTYGSTRRGRHDPAIKSMCSFVSLERTGGGGVAGAFSQYVHVECASMRGGGGGYSIECVGENHCSDGFGELWKEDSL